MKKLLSAVLFLSLSIYVFAKDNPNASTYKTYDTDDKNVPVVYFMKDITPENLVKVYDATGWKPTGKVGVKMSTGEPPASNYLRPELIKNLVQKVNGTIVECNTAYGGKRSSNAMHKQVVKDHGFLDIAKFDLLDEESTISIPVKGGTYLKEDYVGSHFTNYTSYVVLSHFKGYAMGGFGGAIKNLSIGFGSGTSTGKSGKAWIHSAGKSVSNPWGGNQNNFLCSMSEAAKAVDDYMNGHIVYVSVMNRLSVDCDCDGTPAEPDMNDIGVLASTDPLAIDQACIDFVYSAKDSGSLIERIESRQGLTQLSHGEKIGLGAGSRNYRLVVLE
jgi:uncharacterized protein